MDCSLFFKETDIFQENDFRCVLYRHAGEVCLAGTQRYPLLFVLQGTLEMHFRSYSSKLDAGNLMAIDKDSLINIRCTDHTIILEYISPQRLGYYIAQCRKAFNAPCSAAVPILPALWEWIHSLLSGSMQKALSEEEEHIRRKALAEILIKDYPREAMEELYVAFVACSRNGCATCTTEFPK